VREVKRMSEINIHSITFRAARPEQVRTGLLGWASFVLNEAVLIEGVALRQAMEGRYYLAFPVRRELRGRRLFYVRPLDDHARRDIEHQVLAALNLEVAP
jgi:hypothetical protein